MDARGDRDGDGRLVAARDGQLGGLRQHRAGKHDVGEEVHARGDAERVLGALRVFRRRAVPVDHLFRVHHGRGRAGLVRGDVGLHELSPRIVGEASRPLGGAIVFVVGLRATMTRLTHDVLEREVRNKPDVMTLTKV